MRDVGLKVGEFDEEGFGNTGVDAVALVPVVWIVEKLLSFILPQVHTKVTYDGKKQQSWIIVIYLFYR